MLDVARRLAAQSGVANVRFVRGDAQSCLLRPDSFDVAISSFGVMFFDDPVTAFAEIAGTLRRDGRLAFLCWQSEMDNEVFSIPLRAFAASAHPLRSPSGDLFTDPRKVTALLSRTGWADIQVSPVSEPAWLGSDVGDVMSYVRGMPLIQNLAASAGDEALTGRALTDIARQYAARQQPGGVWVRAAAWLVTAHRA
jgi:SAM-dependent methyltransferase